jgi:trans-aconitate 2-methyltransferase
MTWSPQQYVRFEDDRTRPVRDLVAAIPNSAPGTAVDLGCGPGNSTEILAARYPDAAITGLDSDVNMIAAARKRLPAISFEIADIAHWQGQADVILSNAVLHWLPDHATLLPRLVTRLTTGGTLAIQMPENLDEPAYRVMREVAGPDLLARAGGQRGSMETADAYYGILKAVCTRVDIWRTTYFHVLENTDAIVEWFKGSGLRPYLQALDEPGRADFLARYRAGIAAAYPTQPDGTALLPFPRLFLVATR